jgi:cytochrome c-type biogenesis protein CcmH/NrfF
LHDAADVGASGSAPFVEIATVARWVLPLVLLMVGIVLGIYFAPR